MLCSDENLVCLYLCTDFVHYSNKIIEELPTTCFSNLKTLKGFVELQIERHTTKMLLTFINR